MTKNLGQIIEDFEKKERDPRNTPIHISLILLLFNCFLVNLTCGGGHAIVYSFSGFALISLWYYGNSRPVISEKNKKSITVNVEDQDATVEQKANLRPMDDDIHSECSDDSQVYEFKYKENLLMYIFFGGWLWIVVVVLFRVINGL